MRLMRLLLKFLRAIRVLRKPDKYDEAINFLVANPDKIMSAWSRPSIVTGGALFQLTSRGSRPGEYECYGCLTQIRRPRHTFISPWPDLTAQIRADDLIPTYSRDLAALRGDELRRVLERFAYYQREIDRREFKRLSANPCSAGRIL